ncbi:Golgi CORVET complex core vacuolar protein 8-domain-containing protein [Powellomyces hirtus]|nr:Golgi CORVET complex core vacuolar protein 8-domain-containing protein [Powellomyces hirtus]
MQRALPAGPRALKELHMSDLGSLENLFDDHQGQHAERPSELRHSASESVLERMATSSPGPDGPSPRPFAAGFRLPAWGRRFTGERPQSRASSDGRFSVTSSGGESHNGSPSGSVTGRPSVTRAATDKPNRTDRWKDDTGKTEEAALTELSSQFASIVINEDLADADQALLQSKIDNLHKLQSDILRHLYTNDLSQRERARTLLESVVEEIAVYGEFLEASDKGDTLGVVAAKSNDNGISDYVSIMSPSQVIGDNDSGDSRSIEDSPSERSSEASAHATPLVYSPRMPRHTRKLSVSTATSAVSLSSSTVPSLGTSMSLDADSLMGLTAPPGPKDVLRWTSLQRLALQLFTGAMRQKVGTPTCMQIAGGILIGTSRSVVLVYDFSQTLKVILGDVIDEGNPGPVTSISLGFDQTQLVCGYGHGLIRVWDIQKRAIIRTVLPISGDETKREGHPQGSSIVHVAFVGSKGAFVSADNEGNAFHHAALRLYLLNTTYITRIHPSTPTATSIPTTIYAMSVLPRIRGHQRYPGDQLHLVALSTPYKMAIMSMKPSPQPQFRMSWSRDTAHAKDPSDRASRASCLAWSPLLKTIKDGKAIKLSDPLLACSFGRNLRIIRVMWRNPSKRAGKGGSAAADSPTVEYVIQGNWVGQDDIVALQWLDEKFLLLLTSKQILISFDVHTMREIESTDVVLRNIYSADYFSGSLRSLQLPPHLSYQQSLKAFKGRLFILGQRELTVSGRLSWTDRIKALVVYGHFQDAIALGLKFCKGAMRHAVTGLPNDGDARRQVVGNHLSELLMTYIDMSLTSYEAADRQLHDGEDLNVYRQLAATAFDTCLGIEREDLLFGDIYEQFCDKDLQPVFLELLEVYILDERVTSFSNPTIVQDFMAHYENQGWFNRLEQVILHLDTLGLDVHRTIGICLNRRLYSALIYVYTRVGDFVMPIVELLQVLQHAEENDETFVGSLSHSPESASSADPNSAGGALYTLYVYLAYTLTGKAFPVGVLEDDEAVSAKEDVYSFLFSPLHASWPPGGSVQMLGEGSYPYIRLLYRYDSREFMKAVAAMLTDDALGSHSLKIRQNVFVADQEGLGRFADRYDISRQSIVDALFAVVEGDQMGDFSKPISPQTEAGLVASNPATIDLYCFAARNYARFRDSLTLSHTVLRRMLLTLALTEDNGTHDARQCGILALLSTDFEPSETEEEKIGLLQMYENASMWRVYELVIRRQLRYELVLRSYVEDPERRERSFEVVSHLMRSDELSAQQRNLVKNSVFNSIVALIHIDEVETANLITTFWPSAHPTIIKSLADHPPELFQYLKGLLDAKWVLSLRAVPSGSTEPVMPKNLVPPSNVGEFVYEQYIGLLCEKEPSHVKEFLEGLSTGEAGYPYNFDRVSIACKNHNIIDAAAWILEQSGNFEGSLALILDSVRKVVIARADASREDTANDETQIASVRSGIEMALQLCRRSSQRLRKNEREGLWFRMLDEVVELQHGTAPEAPMQSTEEESDELQESGIAEELADPMHAALSESSREILYSMVGHVALHSIILRIVHAQQTASFGEHRAIIFSMLESYTYERELLEATNRILTHDVHASHLLSTKLRRGALRPARGQCAVCQRLLHVRAMAHADRNGKVAVMKCKHAYHVSCLQREMSSMAEREGWDEVGEGVMGAAGMGGGWCVICARKSGSKKAVARKLALASARRAGKGKEKMVIQDESQLETAGTQDHQEPSKISQADLYLRLSSQKPTHTLYTLLAPHHGPDRSHNPYDDEEDGVIDHGYSSATWADTSINSDTSLGHHTLDPGGTSWGTAIVRRLPADVIKNPRKYSLMLAPPDRVG